jgi:protoporphyrinogen oxidase
MIVIIGAGVSGLTAAHNLPAGSDYIILEKSSVPGGLATQFRSGDYWFDYGGHYFHFQDKPEIKTYLERFCRFREFKRKSKTFLLNRYIPFPVQFHLSYLPAPVRSKILQEMLEHDDDEDYTAANLQEFLLHHFGETLTSLFFNPFLGKYYNTDLSTLAANMDKGSIPVPDRERVQAGYTGKTFASAGYNPVIYYPAPSLRSFIQRYAEPVNDRIRYNEEVVAVDSRNKIVQTTAGSTYRYDRLVTSMPLKRLLEIITPRTDLPSPDRLRHTSTLLVNAVLKRKRKRFHWVYLAEEKFPFYRAGLYAGHPFPACYLERNVPPGVPPVFDRDALLADISFTLKELQIIENSAEIRYFDARIIPVSYVVFDTHWHSLVPPALKALEARDIYSIGRFGTWNYSSMANDIRDAREAAGSGLGPTPAGTGPAAGG